MPNRRNAVAAALLGISLVLTAACGEEKAATLRPSIALYTDGGAPLSELSFGDVPIASTGEQTFVIRSEELVPLRVTALEFASDDAATKAAFSATPAAPFDVASLEEAQVTIRFRPTEARRYLATAVVRSNDPDRAEVRVALVGDGVAGRLEVLACLPSTTEAPSRCADTVVSPPEALALGDVTSGDHAAALVTLRNGGGDTLQVTSVAFADPDAAAAAGFSIPEEAGAGTTIPSLAADDFTVNFDPPAGGALGATSAVVVIESDSDTDPRLEIELQANVVPNSEPEACLYVRSVQHADGSVDDYEPGDPVPQVEPTDVVTFDAVARPGCSGDPEDGEAVTVEFALTAPNAAARLKDVAGEPFQRTLEAEATGTYRVEVAVTDSLGLTTSEDAAGVPAAVEIQVVPRRDIAVEIGWTGDPLVDIDLHFVRGSKDKLWSDVDDAYWDNPAPNWGDIGDLFDDPNLLFDDQGFGALIETATLNRPEAGQSYWVFARFNKDDRSRSEAADCTTDASCGAGLVCGGGKCMEPVEVTLKLFLESAEYDLALVPGFNNPRELKGPCDTWIAGRIIWPATTGGAPVFQAEDVVFNPDEAPTGNVCNVQ
ncbi:choice-of-anchor D domain-containing protein [Vulgatibacter sp.]|uniref:choice-of-anchor D domain-containing protein n=1 Tax=Vulgatibacter sp. TaxID=1971226 RepID=UPI003562762B